jgi:hypothetical protein
MRSPATKVPFLCLFFISIVALYPGFLGNDSAAQLIQARTGVFDNWHPPIMAWIWRQMEFVVRGSFGMLVLQTGLIWIGLYLIITSYVTNQSLRAAIAAAAIFFFPPLISWSGAIFKDILMYGFALVGFGLVANWGTGLPFKKGPDIWRVWARITAIAVCLTMICALRHNSLLIAAAIATFLSLTLTRYVTRPIAWIVPLVLLLASSAAAISVNRILTHSTSYPLMSLIGFDVSGIVAREYRNPDFVSKYSSQITEAVVLEGRRVDELSRYYRPSEWYPSWNIWSQKGPLRFPETASEREKLQQLWFDLVTDYPGAYLSHRWAAFVALLGAPVTRMPDGVWITDAGVTPVLQDQIDKIPKLSELQALVGWRLSVLSSLVFFKPYLYFLVSPFLFLVIYRSRFDNRNLMLSLVGSGIFYELSLFFITPSADYRYSLWLIASVWISAVVIVVEFLGARDTRRTLQVSVHQDKGISHLQNR